ncbi:membrane protein insertase YidC [Pseudanabaena sp. PCC 6802]|uniref:membrane protein insertase YidC n=1 Tax=Pseudanabaena sp. PCC 6802 TaxID=118173 RepID=UPI0004762609|nr:membrane protein insertase YidC [Pseudanabaena sp. PCC 6802]
MDFGVGFLSNNVMLPILDFFYGIFPSYGLAIVALTLVIRFALFPVSANQIRSMRRMKIANPIMQQRIKEVQERYKTDPAKQQEEMGKVNAANFKEFGNPLSGCLPALLQMPILFALFATLRGSPFADINYNINFQVFPKEQQEQIQPQAFVSPPQNIYFADEVHYPIIASIPSGTNLVAGEQTKIALQTSEGEKFDSLNAKFPDIDLTPTWHVTKGSENVELLPDGTVKAIHPGEVTVQATIPGLAANKGFLFIQALGKVGVTNPDGSISWDILIMVLGFGISLYINQALSGGSSKSNSDNQQQETMNKVTPIIFSGMFLFFPLPAGVLLYMLVANVFQTVQAFIVSKEPLPENLQKLVEAQASVASQPIPKSQVTRTETTKPETTKPQAAKTQVTKSQADKPQPDKAETKPATETQKTEPKAIKPSESKPVKAPPIKPKSSQGEKSSLPFEPGSSKSSSKKKKN